MKRFVLTTALVLSLCASAMAQNGADNLDVQRFELTPTAPPAPALKYQFLFRDAFERRSGKRGNSVHVCDPPHGPGCQGQG